MDVSNYTNVDAIVKDVFSLGKNFSKIIKINSDNIENNLLKEVIAPILGAFAPVFKIDTDIIGCNRDDLSDRSVDNTYQENRKIAIVISAVNAVIKCVNAFYYLLCEVTNIVLKGICKALTAIKLIFDSISIIKEIFSKNTDDNNVKQHWLFTFLYPVLAVVCLSWQHYLGWFALGVCMHFARQYFEKNGCGLILDTVNDFISLLMSFTDVGKFRFAIASTVQLGIGMLPIIAKLTVNACRWLSGYLGSSSYQLQPAFNAAA